MTERTPAVSYWVPISVGVYLVFYHLTMFMSKTEKDERSVPNISALPKATIIWIIPESLFSIVSKVREFLRRVEIHLASVHLIFFQRARQSTSIVRW